MGSAADIAFDKGSLLATVEEAAFGVGVFVFREEPEADGNLHTVVEELAGEVDHVFSAMVFQICMVFP